ncbi:MAG: hypothetical protein ACFCBU_18790 [Cyanophyceae cyanobacterium]
MNRLERLHDAHLTVDGYINIAITEIKKNISSLAILFGLFYVVAPFLALAPFFETFVEFADAISVFSDRSTPVDPEELQVILEPILSLIALPAIVAFIVLSITFTWLSLATAVIIERSIRGKPINVFNALGITLLKTPVAIIVGLITSVLFALGFLLISAVLIIPSALLDIPFLIFIAVLAMIAFTVYLNVCLTFTNYAIALRDRSVDAISYSFSLVRGQWRKTFGKLGLLILIGFGISVLVNVASSVIDLVIAPFISIVSPIVSLIALFIAYAWTVIYAIMFLHFDYVRNPVI